MRLCRDVVKHPSRRTSVATLPGVTIVAKRDRTEARERSLANLAPPVAAGTERAAALSAAGNEAKRKRAQRGADAIAADALVVLLRRVEAYVAEEPVSPKDAPALIRALADVARGPKGSPDAASIAAEVVSSLRRAAEQQQRARGGATPAVDVQS